MAARIRRMNAIDLVHRTVVNSHGAEFHLTSLQLEADSGRITFWLTPYDEDGNLVSNDPIGIVGIDSLDGWMVV